MTTRYDERYKERYTPRYNYRYGLEVYFASARIVGTVTPEGTVGVAYTASQLSAVGLDPNSWTMQNGPPGLTINAGTGAITGTPSSAGLFNNVLIEIEADGVLDASTQSITIYATVVLTGTLTATGTNGQPYTGWYTATGGKSPWTWALASGTLPTGTTLNTSTGVIQGTLSATGTFNPVIRVTDALGNTTTRTNAIVIS